MAIFFALFILGCGATHVMDVVNIWEPFYRLDAGIRIVTALASIGTAILLVKITPHVLLIPSASEWKRVNDELVESHKKLKHSYDDLANTEELLRKSNVDLEEKVKVRTVELENKNKELKKINYDLDSFVYVASHDLKAPISNLHALTNMVKDELKEGNIEGLPELLNLITDSVIKFDTTVHYLSDITRISKSAHEDIQELQFEKLYEEVVASIKELIRQTDLQIQTSFTQPDIVFSKIGLRSLLDNLLTNAIKYRSSERKPLILLSTIVEDGYIVLQIKDNGIGFDITKKEKVFQMFQRLHTHVEGTGVGLYMVQRIVENAGGKIEVDSEKNAGTTFKLYLKPMERK